MLRRFRQRHMLRIVWRDFCRLADTLETVRDTSLLAEACIAEALDLFTGGAGAALWRAQWAAQSVSRSS